MKPASVGLINERVARIVQDGSFHPKQRLEMVKISGADVESEAMFNSCLVAMCTAYFYWTQLKAYHFFLMKIDSSE